MRTQAKTEKASPPETGTIEQLIEKAQDLIVEGKDPNGAVLNLNDALCELERVKAQLEEERAAKMQWARATQKAAQQRDRLLAALKWTGVMLIQGKPDWEIRDHVVTAIAAAEGSNQ